MEKENKITEPGSLMAKINEYKGEFKRIIWLKPAELKKSTITVIGVCIIFFIIIFCYDIVFTQAMTWITKLVG